MRDSSEDLGRNSTLPADASGPRPRVHIDEASAELAGMDVAAKTSRSGRVLYTATLRPTPGCPTLVGCGSSRDSAVANLIGAARASRRRALPARTTERLVTAAHTAVREIHETSVASRPRRHPAYAFLRLLQGTRGRR